MVEAQQVSAGHRLFIFQRTRIHIIDLVRRSLPERAGQLRRLTGRRIRDGRFIRIVGKKTVVGIRRVHLYRFVDQAAATADLRFHIVHNQVVRSITNRCRPDGYAVPVFKRVHAHFRSGCKLRTRHRTGFRLNARFKTDHTRKVRRFGPTVVRTGTQQTQARY